MEKTPSYQLTTDLTIFPKMQNTLSQIVLRNPIHLLSFGFGAGLSPVAPGTIGTLGRHTDLPGTSKFFTDNIFNICNYSIFCWLLDFRTDS